MKKQACFRIAACMLCALLTCCGRDDSVRSEPSAAETTVTQSETTVTETASAPETESKPVTAETTVPVTAATTTTATTTSMTTTTAAATTTTAAATTTAVTTTSAKRTAATTVRTTTTKRTTAATTSTTAKTTVTAAKTTAAAGGLTQESVYAALLAMQKKYPEGTPWTNAEYYAWKGGVFTDGNGCAAFAFRLSDAAFGDLPARKFYDYSALRAGDLLRVMDDQHFVVVLEVRKNEIVLAEGNYDGTVHWFRKMPMSEVFSSSTVYGITRYPA